VGDCTRRNANRDDPASQGRPEEQLSSIGRWLDLRHQYNERSQQGGKKHHDVNLLSLLYFPQWSSGETDVFDRVRAGGGVATPKANRCDMAQWKILMRPDKKIALVAHDNKKRDLVEWAKFNRDLLAHHDVYATGTTGATLEHELDITIHRLQSGPLGGDQQIGAKIVENEIDFLIFFWDPLEPLPHDPDVKALLRMAVVWNIPIACNRASADFMISSPLMDGEYYRLVPDYEEYRTRRIGR
jgi:methylglyoxal synthase